MATTISALNTKVSLDATDFVNNANDVLMSSERLASGLRFGFGRSTGIETLNEQLNETKNGAEKARQAFDGIFSKRGGVGQFGELLKGGGAIAGVTLLSNQVGNLADQFNRMFDAVKSGQATFDQAANDFVRAIPIIGNVASVAESLYRILGGEISDPTAYARTEQSRRRRMDAEMAEKKRIQDLLDSAGGMEKLEELSARRAGGDMQAFAIRSRAAAKIEEMMRERGVGSGSPGRLGHFVRETEKSRAIDREIRLLRTATEEEIKLIRFERERRNLTEEIVAGIKAGVQEMESFTAAVGKTFDKDREQLQERLRELRRNAESPLQRSRRAFNDNLRFLDGLPIEEDERRKLLRPFAQAIADAQKKTAPTSDLSRPQDALLAGTAAAFRAELTQSGNEQVREIKITNQKLEAMIQEQRKANAKRAAEGVIGLIKSFL